MNPFYDKTTESGQIPKYVYRDGVNYIWNPMWDFNQNSYNQSENWSLTDNFQLEWTIINSLRFRANLQYQLQNQIQKYSGHPMKRLLTPRHQTNVELSAKMPPHQRCLPVA